MTYTFGKTSCKVVFFTLDSVDMSYNSEALQPPVGLCAHSTLVTSWALFQGVSVSEICVAKLDNTSHFHQILQIGCTAPTLSFTVLSVGSVLNMSI